MSSAHTDQDDAVPFLHISGLSMLAVLMSAVIAWSDDSTAAAEAASSESAESHTVEKPLIKPLLDNETLSADDWVFVSKQKDSKLADTWTVSAMGDDPVLICRGAPYGYLRTQRQFADFEMELEWKFPADENGNSGILLYTSEEDKIWPKAIQIQLHQPVAGSIFPSGDAKTDNEIRDVRDLAKPVNQWNVCRISSKSGTISVEMNGRKVGEVTGCLPKKGWIALQSEGSEVHFRRMRIRELPADPEAESPDAKTGGLLPRPPCPACQWIPLSCCQIWVQTSELIDAEDSEITVSTHRRPRPKRIRNTTYVVYRDVLAAHAPPPGGSHGLWLDVDRTSATVVAGRCDRLRRAECRRLGL